jgi:hypothetical protein
MLFTADASQFLFWWRVRASSPHLPVLTARWNDHVDDVKKVMFQARVAHHELLHEQPDIVDANSPLKNLPLASKTEPRCIASKIS